MAGVPLGHVIAGMLTPFVNRCGENAATYYRCGRYATVGHQCFVMLRNGQELGPFQNRIEAEVALVEHVAARLLAAPGELAVFNARPRDASSEFGRMVQEVLDFKEALQLRSVNCAYAWVLLKSDPDEECEPLDPLRQLLYEHLRDELDESDADVIKWIN